MYVVCLTLKTYKTLNLKNINIQKSYEQDHLNKVVCCYCLLFS